jgi:hypothetical protein
MGNQLWTANMTLSVAGLVAPALFTVSVYKNREKSKPTDTLVFGLVISCLLTPGTMLLVEAGVLTCDGQALLLSFAFLLQNMMATAISVATLFNVWQAYVLSKKGAYTTIVVLFAFALAWTGVWFARGSPAVPMADSLFCFVDLSALNGIGMLWPAVSCSMIEMAAWAGVYALTRQTFLNANMAMYEPVMEMEDFSIDPEAAAPKVSTPQPPRPTATLTSHHSRLLWRMIGRMCMYMVVSYLQIFAALVAQSADAAGGATLLISILLLSPTTTVAYAYTNVEHRKRLLCALQRRDSWSSDIGKLGHPTANVEQKGEENVRRLENGILLAYDPKTKVPMVHRLKPGQLLMDPEGAKMALALIEERDLQCKESVLFRLHVQEFKKLRQENRASPMMAWSKGKYIVQTFVLGDQKDRVNIGAILPARLVKTFHPDSGKARGDEFDDAVVEIDKMLLGQGEGDFIGQFQRSQYFHDFSNRMEAMYKSDKASPAQIVRGAIENIL